LIKHKSKKCRNSISSQFYCIFIKDHTIPTEKY